MELAAVLTLINIGLACWNIWKEVRPRPAPRTEAPLQVVQIHPHPLEAALHDVAAAIRGQAPRSPLDARGRSI